MNDNLISLAEAAKLRNVDRSTIWRWIKAGLPAQQIGKAWVVDRESLLSYQPRKRGKPAKESNQC